VEQSRQNTFKFDFHVHTKLSRSIPFNLSDLNLLITHAKRMGLDGFAITEHINAPDYWETYEQIGRRFLCESGIYYVEPGFHIINGAEITLKGKGDILALGDIRSIQALDLKLNLSGSYHPTLEELIDEAPEDLILIGAHPFRPRGGIMKFDPAAIRQLVALEVNGKDFGQEDQVEAAARSMDLPTVAGSDTHYWPQLGIRRTVLQMPSLTIPAIKQAIKSRQASYESEPNGPLMVQICKHHKTTLKTALGLYDNTPGKLIRSVEKEVLGERQDRVRVL